MKCACMKRVQRIGTMNQNLKSPLIIMYSGKRLPMNMHVVSAGC